MPSSYWTPCYFVTMKSSLKYKPCERLMKETFATVFGQIVKNRLFDKLRVTNFLYSIGFFYNYFSLCSLHAKGKCNEDRWCKYLFRINLNLPLLLYSRESSLNVIPTSPTLFQSQQLLSFPMEVLPANAWSPHHAFCSTRSLPFPTSRDKAQNQ